jgi:hypothetical protein
MNRCHISTQYSPDNNQATVDISLAIANRSSIIYPSPTFLHYLIITISILEDRVGAMAEDNPPINVQRKLRKKINEAAHEKRAQRPTTFFVTVC